MPSPNAAEALRDPLLLRLALRAYPPADRRGYGDELMEAAVELATESSVRREAWGLVKGGSQARLTRGQMGLRAVSLSAGLDRACVPIAALVVAIWSIAGVTRVLGSAVDGDHVKGLSAGSLALLAELAVVVVAVARRQRLPAAVAASALALQVLASAIWATTRAVVVTAAPIVPLHLGPWWFGPSLIWSMVPFAILLIPACLAMQPPAPRVPGIPRPVRESALVRALYVVAPASLLGITLVVSPQLIFQPGSVGATTEIPGILALMLVVGALWFATSPAVHQESLAVAGALIGLAAIPSVAYGAARLVLDPVRDDIGGRDTLVVVGVGLGIVFVVLAALLFVVTLAQVGLRALDRRGGSALAVGHAIPLGPDPSSPRDSR